MAGREIAEMPGQEMAEIAEQMTVLVEWEMEIEWEMKAEWKKAVHSSQDCPLCKQSVVIIINSYLLIFIEYLSQIHHR